MEVCNDCLLVSSGYSEDEVGHPLPELPLVFIELEEDEEEHFSWNPCDLCGNRDGGGRWTVTVSYK